MDEDAQLDGLKIRQLSTLRRATYRSRSHAIIATGVCGVAAVQCGVMAGHELRTAGLSVYIFGYAIFLVLGIWGTIFFTRRAIRLHREAKQTTIPQPQSTPDFSTLGDGSDLADRLNRIE